MEARPILTSNRTRLYGIDGCRGGWVVAAAAESLGSVTFALWPSFGAFTEQAGNDCLICVDIPIGLPDRESRTCDREARALLGWPRRNSVFSPPARTAILATTFEEALRANHEALGVGLTMQSFCIMPKIREVDEDMTQARQRFVREVHPEVTFALLNGGSAMEHNKSTQEGRQERLAVLDLAGVHITQEALMHERLRLTRRLVALDDLIDALACLVTACHSHSNRSRSLGGEGQRDTRGLLMEIVAPSLAVRSAKA